MIIGERVILRALSSQDSKKILGWVNNPELKFLTGTVFPVSEFEHEEWFAIKTKEKINKIFGIQDKYTEELIGVIGFNNTDLINRNTEMYIYIGDEKYWGKGYGSDSVNTLVRFAFEELNLHRVSLMVFSYNKRAINTYKKVGFVSEGILKQSLYKDGTYHDKILMAVLRNSYRSFSEKE